MKRNHRKKKRQWLSPDGSMVITKADKKRIIREAMRHSPALRRIWRKPKRSRRDNIVLPSKKHKAMKRLFLALILAAALYFCLRVLLKKRPLLFSIDPHFGRR